jgi:hypothetical protein
MASSSSRRASRYLRCSELFLSVPSRRFDARDAELRLPAGNTQVRNDVPIYVRAPRIVQQGPRLVARDAVFAASDQGAPSTRVHSEQLTITRLGDVLLLEGLGNELRTGSLPSIPLPNFRRYSDDDSEIPIKGFQAGSSDSRGMFALIVFGGRFNDVGQVLANFLMEDAPRFRGTWRFRTGWMEERGVPMEPTLEYELEGLLDGSLEAFYLEDSGTDVRSPNLWLDGSPIDEDTRRYMRTRNRIQVSESMTLDVEIFEASDPASYPEFRLYSLLGEEAPETSAYLRWAESNMRASLSGRWNANDFAYGDDALLTGRFRKEEPEARFDLFHEPLFDIDDAVPLVSTVSLRAGRLANEATSRAPGLVDQESARLDGQVELSVPLRIGDWGLRFFASGRETYYSEIADGEDGGREAFELGALLSTRFARDFELDAPFLGAHGLQHEILPQVRALSRFEVTRDPGELYAFDEVEDLRELHAFDLVLLQRLHGYFFEDGEWSSSELVWLDLEQRFHPTPDRDNNGETLGLFKWELLLRPSDRWAFLLEGEHDWDAGRDKTRNLGFSSRPLDWLSLAATWRAGADGQGTGLGSMGFALWQRWYSSLSYVYNFELSRSENWSVSLSRRDYDWEWQIVMSNNILNGEQTFQVRFRPVLDQRLRMREATGFEDVTFGRTSRSSY